MYSTNMDVVTARKSVCDQGKLGADGHVPLDIRKKVNRLLANNAMKHGRLPSPGYTNLKKKQIKLKQKPL